MEGERDSLDKNPASITKDSTVGLLTLRLFCVPHTTDYCHFYGLVLDRKLKKLDDLSFAHAAKELKYSQISANFSY